jgi:hypothetical protein
MDETQGSTPSAASPAPPSGPGTGTGWTWEGLPRAEQPPMPPVPPARPRRRLPLILLAVLLVAGGAVGSVAVLNSGSGAQEVASAPPSSPAASPSPSPSASPSPTEVPAPLPPLSFDARAPKLPIGVKLSWEAPVSGTAVTSYRLYRGDKEIASLAAGETAYTDSDVKPGKHYAYAIESLNGLDLVSDRASVEVDVPVPALKDARVAGNYNVKATVESSYGFADLVQSFTLGWNFKPKCGEGACKVTWKDLFYKDLKATLDHSGATYTGSDSGKFNVQCGSVNISSTMTLDVHVTKAKAIDGVWKATRLEGTLTQTEPSQLGCVSSGATYSVTVTLV